MRAHRIGLISTRLYYFEAVARSGSIRSAARKLNVTPSAISRSISQLEQDLDTPLFSRGRQKLKLTSAGEILIYHARSTQAELNKANDLIDDLKGLKRGSVTIAAAESPSRSFLPELMAQFWKKYPDITAEITVMGSRQAFDSVAEGGFDLALAFDDNRTRKVAGRIASANLQLGAVLRPDHPLARKREARMQDFANERVLLSDSSLTLSQSIEKSIRKVFSDDGPRLRTNAIGLMTAMSIRGAGVAFQTRVGIEAELDRGDLVFVPLRDPQLGPRKLVLMTRPSAQLSSTAAALSDMIARMLDRIK
ncbi:MAG TPA: LysR family transcriptional regulator [Afipia sp.]